MCWLRVIISVDMKLVKLIMGCDDNGVSDTCSDGDGDIM